MPDGVVDFFNDTGGYGFIETDAVSEDVFFHLEEFNGIDDVDEGNRVEFDIEEAAKGPRAKNMSLVSDSGALQSDCIGLINFYNDTGGYGFIETDAVDEDVFFNNEDVFVSENPKGAYVEFDVKQNEKGFYTERMRRISASDVPPNLKGKIGSSSSSSNESTDDTSIYDPKDNDNTDTQIYDNSDRTDDSDTTCDSCGHDLSEYETTNFCPACGIKI